MLCMRVVYSWIVCGEWRYVKAVKKIHVGIAWDVLSRAEYLQRSHFHETLHSSPCGLSVCVCVSLTKHCKPGGEKKSQFGYFQDISPLVVHALPDSSIGSLEGVAICANLFGLISNCMVIWNTKVQTRVQYCAASQLFNLMENHLTTQEKHICISYSISHFL